MGYAPHEDHAPHSRPLAHLLAPLREHGCIAYLDEEGRCVHAVPAEGTELEPLLDAWSAAVGVRYELRD